jgi:hypothetical protein
MPLKGSKNDTVLFRRMGFPAIGSNLFASTFARFVVLTAIIGIVCQSAFAAPLDVYRDENRLIVMSFPQGAALENVNAMLVLNRQKIEERHLKIIDVSEVAQRISTAVRLTPDQTDEVRRQLRLTEGETNPTFVLIGKDGGEAARSFHILDLEKWFAFIDEMPMRRAEILEQKKQASEPWKN